MNVIIIILSIFLSISSAEKQEECGKWNLVWFTNQWYEEHYVPDQLLKPSGFDIEKIVVHELRPDMKKLDRRDIMRGDLDRQIDANIDEALQNIEECSILVVRIRQFPGCERTTRIAKAYSDVRHFFILVGEENEMSCETCSEFYDVAPFVARHYHDDSCDTRRVMTIPMGTIKPLNSSISTDTLAASREYVWSFASGHRNGARDQMVRWLRSNKNVNSVKHHLTYPGRDPNYVHTMSNTAIAMCPRGNHEETWRLYESIAYVVFEFTCNNTTRM